MLILGMDTSKRETMSQDGVFISRVELDSLISLLKRLSSGLEEAYALRQDLSAWLEGLLDKRHDLEPETLRCGPARLVAALPAEWPDKPRC